MDAKECIKCGEVKPLDDFNRNARCTDGRSNICSACSAAYQREWRRNNPGKQREYNQRNYYAHRDERLDYGKRYYREHREHCLKRSKAWRVANNDIVEEYRKRKALAELRGTA